MDDVATVKKISQELVEAWREPMLEVLRRYYGTENAVIVTAATSAASVMIAGTLYAIGGLAAGSMEVLAAQFRDELAVHMQRKPQPAH